MDTQLSLAPIQGITNHIFRNALHKHIGGVDKYYAPYLRIDKEKHFRPSKQYDILPENNPDLTLIPQIMVNNSADFLKLAEFIESLGYTELNWNLGCPYPMVTNRKLGAGLLPHHTTIIEILNHVLPKIKISVSIKMRSGLTDDTELEKLLPKLNPFPLSEIIIHPRFAKQLYKEKANPELFKACSHLSAHQLAYNGDVFSPDSFRTYKKQIPAIDHFMLGRGLVANPFLARQIRSAKGFDIQEASEQFQSFHNELFENTQKMLRSEGQTLLRMKSYWGYFSHGFSNNRKAYKLIKKSNSFNKYHEATRRIFKEQSLLLQPYNRNDNNIDE